MFLMMVLQVVVWTAGVLFSGPELTGSLVQQEVVQLQAAPGGGAAETDAAPALCLLSELRCNDGRCIPNNKFCDGISHCLDGSDEPKHCTPCNRTYYGEVGRSYELELHRPKEARLPYLCRLTLSAAGGQFGDIVQVTLERFTLGKFLGFLREGCPDGWLSIEERGRPAAGGGLWCGSSWGPVIYYSESDQLTLRLALLTLSSSGQNSGYNFDFRISYKMLSRGQATTRYGRPILRDPSEERIEKSAENSIEDLELNRTQGEYYLGNRIGMTYCSRMYSDCDRKTCRLQSPNFPGVYPRNMTCYFAVRQASVAPGRHALISVFQDEGQLINVRSRRSLYLLPTQATSASASPRLGGLKVWKECEEVQDYVTIYDGYTTRDPVLLKFCGGGSPLPRAISSGPELLVEFSTSPFGTFFYPEAPAQPLHGFQLKVEVEMVEREEPVYSRNKKCEFWISGSAGHGQLESPRNSLPPNTSCLYHLWGAEDGGRGSLLGPPPPAKPHSRPTRFRVWLSILKYHVGSPFNSAAETGGGGGGSREAADCSTSLKVWDGTIKTATLCVKENCGETRSEERVVRPGVRLLASYCSEQIPRSCDHRLISNLSRPCSVSESFLTAGDSATLELRILEATVLRKVYFKAQYEFVDLHQDGEGFGTGKCWRVFNSRQLPPHLLYKSQNFASPRNVFFFGRGGATNISCRYRFEAGRGERVKLTITNLRTGNRTDCATTNQAGWGRLECLGRLSAFLSFQEVPFPDSDIYLPKDCLCSKADSYLPFVYLSKSNVVELKFSVSEMSPLDDYREFGFEGSWEFERRKSDCPARRLSGPSGEIHFSHPSERSDCEEGPVLIEPSEGQYLYVKTAGLLMGRTGESAEGRAGCPSPNRLELHARSTHLMVCPAPDRPNSLVEVFSDGWAIGTTAERLPASWAPGDRRETRNMVVEFTGRQEGVYLVTWLEIQRRRSEELSVGLARDCAHKCPELDACINSSLWCDGSWNCPSGYDESPSHCLPLPPVQLALLAIIALIVISLLTTFSSRCRQRRSSGRRSRSLKSLPSDTDTIVSSSDRGGGLGGGNKEVIC